MSTTAEPVTGRIHSWDLSTGVDGPGTRFVLFVNGCPPRCLYCANPDTWHLRDGRDATVDDPPDVGRVEVLPFHKLGAAKYDALGLPFPLRDTPSPGPELVRRIREQFRERGLTAF